METPQYLRKLLYPIHRDLKFAGLLNPLDAPHHLRADGISMFREGVTVDRGHLPGQTAINDSSPGSLVNIGLTKDCKIDRNLKNGVRVTVQIDDYKRPQKRKKLTGKAVSPSYPREQYGIYWGYTTRIAASLRHVITQSPYPEGYDITIGTSDHGQNAQAESFKLPRFKHLLVVFGGVQGIEECMVNDEELRAKHPEDLFDYYINTCPSQGARTIRTEEAIPITMSVLQRHILNNQTKKFK